MRNPNHSESDTYTLLPGDPARSWRPHLLFTPLIGILPLIVEDPTYAYFVDGKSNPLRVTALKKGVASHSGLSKSFRGWLCVKASLHHVAAGDDPNHRISPYHSRYFHVSTLCPYYSKEHQRSKLLPSDSRSSIQSNAQGQPTIS